MTAFFWYPVGSFFVLCILTILWCFEANLTLKNKMHGQYIFFKRLPMRLFVWSRGNTTVAFFIYSLWVFFSFCAY